MPEIPAELVYADLPIPASRRAGLSGRQVKPNPRRRSATVAEKISATI